MPPDLYVKLYNHPKSDLIKEGLIIAIPKRLSIQQNSIIESELQQLVNLIPNARISMTTRSWWPGWKYYNQIGDMNLQELEKIVSGG